MENDGLRYKSEKQEKRKEEKNGEEKLAVISSTCVCLTVKPEARLS